MTTLSKSIEDEQIKEGTLIKLECSVILDVAITK